MDIGLVRKIDRTLGVAVCGVLSGVYSLEKILRLNKIEGKPKKILLLKPAEMGAMVALYPTIKKAKEMFPGAEFFFVTFDENVPILHLFNIIPKENILELRTDSFLHLFYDTLKSILFLRRVKIDTVIDLEFFSRYSAIFSYMTGAKRRVGFYRLNSEGLYRGEFITHKVGYNYYLHAGLSFLSLLYALKYPPGRVVLKEKLSMDELKIPRLNTTKKEKERIFKKLKEENTDITEKSRIVVLSPAGGPWLPERKWPTRYNIELIKKILSIRDAYVVITGTESAKKDAEIFKKEIKNSRLISLAGKTNFKEFINLLNISKLLVSVDSGPTHFACLTDIWIISIFGPETKRIFAPLSKKAISIESGLACHPCFSVFNNRRCNCDDKEKRCLISITPERVFKEVKKILG
jgi:ADP-heptose:LPS heptosyltransferase